MKRVILVVFLLFVSLEAKLKVVTAYPYIADLIGKVGGDKVEVSSLAKPMRDPHFIVPRPSFIAKVRNADLLVINGGELEIGWIPPLIAQAGNPAVQLGNSGYLDLSKYVVMTGKPKILDRALGDIHAAGNPHFSVDMRQIPKMTAAIAETLCMLDGTDCQVFRENEQRFAGSWSEKVAGWEERLKPLENLSVIQAHRLFDYLLDNARIKTAMTLEPIPGVTPTAKHTADVIALIKKQKIRMLITSVYFPEASLKLVESKTGVRVVTLPHDVGAIEGVNSIEAMFEYIVNELAK